MFELIGMAVVLWIVWGIGKSIVGGSIRGTLFRARDYAENVGVPPDFSKELIEYPDILKQARRELASGDRDFAALDVFEQYGKAIVHLHSKARQVEMLRLKKEVEDVFGPQRDQLHDYSPCFISGLYIMSLTSMLARMTPTEKEVREVFDHCFRHPNLDLAKNKVWEEITSSQELVDDGLPMCELVMREITAKKFEFFYKLHNKYIENHEQGVSESDLAAADPHWYLKL